MPPAVARLGASLPLPPDLAMCRRVAERAEALGYESIWIADTGAGPDAFVVAAAAALATQRLRLGTAVIPIYTRALSVLAAGAGSCAQLMPGRPFVLGLGVSSETIVDAWGGVPYRRPFTRMRESVAAPRDAIRQMMGPYFATSVYNRFVAWCGFADEARAIDAAWRAKDRTRNVAAVTDAMIDRLAIIGSAEHCRSRLAEFVAAGVTTP